MTAPAIFLMGPTASGKTAAAIALAQNLPVELISVDSALVFRGMDIGTAKPDRATLARAPHYLIDLIEPTEAYSAAQFRTDALRLMQDITGRGRVPVLVGGTMLYFNALQYGMHELPPADAALRCELRDEGGKRGWAAMHARLAELDPLTAARLQPGDAQRIERALEVVLSSGRPMSAWLADARSPALPFVLHKLALLPKERAPLHARIATRLEQMLRDGLIDEVARLRRQYDLRAGVPSMRCVGYRQTWQYLDGQIGLAELRDTAIYATRQLAKRQMTWLRGMDDLQTVDCLRADLVEVVMAACVEIVMSWPELQR